MVGLHVIPHWHMTRFYSVPHLPMTPFYIVLHLPLAPVLQCLAIMQLLLVGQSSLGQSNRVPAPNFEGLHLGLIRTPMVIPTFSLARLLIRPKSRRRIIFKTLPPNFLIFFVLHVYIHFPSFLIYYRMPIVSPVPFQF